MDKPTSKVICTPRNFKRFAERFKEENRGQGPYVAALGEPSPYVPVRPGMHDFSEVPNYGYAVSDPLYDPNVFAMEKIYLYVEPLTIEEETIVPDTSPHAKEGAMISQKTQRQTFDWTSAGKAAFVRALELFEKRDRDDRAKRDQCVARLLEQLSPESRTLLNNMKGAAEAIDRNELWTIFNSLLPQSHNQVSTSAVAKRTRDLLSSVQSTSLPAFIEAFARDASQFASDWESPDYPGYIRTDALLRNVFVEAVRAGTEFPLLQPSLEQLSLHSGDHRAASLSAAQEYLSSFYIRNKPTVPIEETVAFKGALEIPGNDCACCSKSSCVSHAELVKILAKLPKPPRVPLLMDSQGHPRFCQSCILSPPPCACGGSRAYPFHKFCAECFRKANPRRSRGRRDSGSDAKAQLATTPCSPPQTTTVTVSPVHDSSRPHPPVSSHPHPHPPWSNPYSGLPPHGYAPPLHHPYYSPRPPPSPEDDALSDYHAAPSPHHHLYLACCPAGTALSDEIGPSRCPLHVPSPVALHAPGTINLDEHPERGTYFIDSGASMHCTDTLSHLMNVRCLAQPITLKGIGQGSASFTHVGDLPWLPPGLRSCFFSPTLGARLISLAYLCRNSRTHFYNIPGDVDSLVIMVDGAHLATCTRSDNNLYPFPSIGRGTFYPPPGGVAPAAFAASPMPLRQLTPEQRSRCDAVERLLEMYCRPSDEALARTISFGGLGSHAAGLTPHDVYLNRLLRGPDVHRAQGRVRDPPARSSLSSPASSPCEALVVDPHHLKHPDIFGNRCVLRIVCEFSGAFWVVPCKTGTAASLRSALERFIHTTCNAYGHRVASVHADAESVFGALVAPFGEHGIRILLAPPGHHARRVERYTQTFAERKRMARAQLKFLPKPELGLDIFLDLHVAASMRHLVNSVSHPNTPEELVTRQRAPLSGLALCPFHALVTVRMGTQKRAALAAAMMVDLQDVPRTELAMCLGRAPPCHPASYYMYIPSTHKVVFRRYFTAIPGAAMPPFCLPNTTYIPVVEPHRHLLPITPPDDCVQGHPIQHPSSASQFRAPPESVMPVPIDLADGADLPLAPSLSEPPVSSIPQPLVHELPHPPRSSPAGIPFSPVAPPVAEVPPPPLRSLPSTPIPLKADVTPSLDTSGRRPPSTVGAVVDRTPSAPAACDLGPVLDSEISTALVPSSPVPPRRRASTRSNFGRPPARFADGATTGRPHSKSLLFAARTQGRYAFCAATWDDIRSAVGPYVLPDPAGGRAFTSPRSVGPGSSPVSAPILCRHVCFLAAAKCRSAPVTGLVLPSVSAIDASPLLRVESSRTLSFSPKENKEMPYRQGVKALPPAEVRAAVAKEFDKLFNTHAALRPIDDAAVQPNAVRIYSSMLLKAKFFGDGTFDKISARLAAGGKNQPERSFDDTYAPTADESSTLCVFAAFAAHAVQHGYIPDICYSNFDVKGAFLWVPRRNATQIVMRIPSYIDHPMAGRNVEVLKSIYGLKDSNANFDADLRKTILSAGFRSTLDPCIYIKTAPNPVNSAAPFRCLISTHVDDGRAMYNHRPFYDELIAALEAKYGQLSKDDNTTSYTGSTFDASPDGSFRLTQEGYVRRLLDSVNYPNLGTRSTPSDSDLFSDTSHMPPCDAKVYRHMVGSLIHLLRTRYDIQKEVVQLSSKMAFPTVGDMAQSIPYSWSPLSYP